MPVIARSVLMFRRCAAVALSLALALTLAAPDPADAMLRGLLGGNKNKAPAPADQPAASASSSSSSRATSTATNPSRKLARRDAGIPFSPNEADRARQAKLERASDPRGSDRFQAYYQSGFDALVLSRQADPGRAVEIGIAPGADELSVPLMRTILERTIDADTKQGQDARSSAVLDQNQALLINNGIVLRPNAAQAIAMSKLVSKGVGPNEATTPDLVEARITVEDYLRANRDAANEERQRYDIGRQNSRFAELPNSGFGDRSKTFDQKPKPEPSRKVDDDDDSSLGFSISDSQSEAE